MTRARHSSLSRRWTTVFLAAAGMLVSASPGSHRGSLPVAAVPFFQEAAQEVGLDFRHFAGAAGEYLLPEIMGAGAALLDYDGDGDLDVYLVQGGLLDPTKKPEQCLFPPKPGERLVNRLFRNDLTGAGGSGRLRFTDVTERAGVGHAGYGMGVATADYDGDGDVDLYVTNFGPNVLYRNNGDGTFTDVTAESGTGDERWSTSAVFFDYDRDGDLDLYVLNYIDFTVAGNKTCYDAAGALDYCNPNLYRPLPDRLFRNDGSGRFADVSESSGISAAVGPGLGVLAADFNQDGRLDLYVANDGAANYLWVNRGDGSFEENGLMSGSAFNADGAPEGSMGVAAGDYDNDGDEDLFMSHLTMETNTLYVNDGKGDFRDETNSTGLAGASLPYTGFGTGWFDYDNDGRLDLFVANGAVRNLPQLRGESYPYHQTNQLFHNLGEGRFREISETAGDAFRVSEVSRGAAFGDLDNDGDVDVLVTNNNGPARLLLNQIGSPKSWLSVILQSQGANRFAAGARVGAVLKGGPTLWRRAGTNGSYLSAGDPRVHFGLGTARLEAVIVEWPDGAAERWRGVASDRFHPLKKGSGERLP